MTSAGEGAAGPRGIGRSLRLLAADIKLAHSVFALPFAILGAFLVGPGPRGDRAAWLAFAGKVALVVVCMIGARTWAMVFNRLADREIDARNERTAGRVIAAGNVSPLMGWLAALAAAGVFVLGAWGFWWFFRNPWPSYLAAPVLAWLAFYSLTKRFTAMCHVVLGLSLAASPVAAAIAVRPEAVFSTPAVWWIAGFVVLWVGGFDVVYALQDEEFDRANSLRSIPVAMGTKGAVWMARAWHAVAVLALLAAWTSHAELGWVFAAGAGLAVCLLVVEHVVLAQSCRRNPSKPRLHAIFFTLNGVVALIVGGAGTVDTLIHP
ncbi:MAG: 4-hydroxybenzoate octaprenyltransferase [Leptolyngbya sp. PLA1]|nr:4-hydroxybenzoate octaprenyltransferase [Leptolyngbya sp. PLA1]